MTNHFKYPTYLVGGPVRDEIMGRKCKDLDFCVVCPSFEHLKQTLLEDGAKIFVEKPEFLTIRCQHPLYGVADFACARSDGSYTDGRHPDSTAIANNILNDLSRRDTTINAMAKDVVTGELIDPFGGREDIKKKVIRFVGKAEDRLNEDKLRAFRALRFSAQLNFNINEDATVAIHKLLIHEFDAVSTERIREELFKMFSINTEESMDLLLIQFPNLLRLVNSRKIWFKPTTEALKSNLDIAPK